MIMTENEINEVVAISIGFKPIETEVYARENWFWVDREGKTHKPPDFCRDLNAMHRIEISLDEESYRKFYYFLHKIRNDDCMPICKCISAPSRQRAEAYLRVKGLWK